ncbi:Os10g0560451 [Oryza sativa Japonica Group]|uniref:Os10g0560451 protein n=1 Tax=Oryza sativa subsp. japonica TaxID=39947 RepID=A0A0P0XX98_ORYSJ|nr:hypothetical protein EE612_052770 [Oryza sativa]BAT12049.1 Os10g0560451 [Oryza sativa Japonica Group]
MSGISSSSSAFLPALKYEGIEFIPSVFPISNVSIDGMSSSSSGFDACTPCVASQPSPSSSSPRTTSAPAASYSSSNEIEPI